MNQRVPSPMCLCIDTREATREAATARRSSHSPLDRSSVPMFFDTQAYHDSAKPGATGVAAGSRGTKPAPRAVPSVMTAARSVPA